MNTALRYLSIIVIAALASLFGLTSSAHADITKAITVHNNEMASNSLKLDPTKLTIDPLPMLELGETPIIVLHLTGYKDVPISGQLIRVFVDGVPKGQDRTDENGTVRIPLRYNFFSGTYKITASYRGSTSRNLTPAIAETSMRVKLGQVVIQTVPKLAGIRFSFNDRTYTTDENGLLLLIIKESKKYRLEVLPVEEGILGSNVQIEFERWNDNVFLPYRDVYLPRSHPLEVGFILKYQVKQIFFDSTGQLVDPSRVSNISMRAVGRIYNFENPDSQWLPSNRLARRIGEHLESHDILYYIRDVTIDGVNVINKSEQRFEVHPDDVWPIHVLLYSASFTARDVIFQVPIGDGIKLEYPDGRHEEFLFDDKNTIDISSLARGPYRATVIGAGGSAPPTPIHLSRDLDVELRVISYLDMAIIFGIPAIIALGLLFYGRPYLLFSLRSLPSAFATTLNRIMRRRLKT